MWRMHLLALLGCVISVQGVRAQFDVRPQPDAVKLDKELTQRWQVGVIIEAAGGPAAGLFGTLPIPTEWPEQTVRVVQQDVSPLVTRVTYRDLPGVRQMLFTLPQLPPGQTAEALITLEVTKSSILAPDNPERFVIPRNAPRDVRMYLGSSPLIECRDTKVVSATKAVTEGKKSAWEQVAAIYDAVRDNIAFREGKTKGAAAAARDRFGNKHDLTSLFIAMCRAHKVPARTVWVPDHVYAEFYLMDEDGEGHWFPCQVAGPRDFGSLSDNRLILQKGDNIRVPEEKDPQRFVPEFLTGKGGRGTAPPRVEFVRKLMAAN